MISVIIHVYKQDIVKNCQNVYDSIFFVIEMYIIVISINWKCVRMLQVFHLGSCSVPTRQVSIFAVFFPPNDDRFTWQFVVELHSTRRKASKI